jgi:hypothetical protein
MPPVIYVGLATAASNPRGGIVTEVSGGSYIRKPISFAAPTTTAEGYARTSNSLEVTFPQATSNLGTITHFFLADAASGGNILDVQQLDSSAQDDQGNTPKFMPGDLVVEER